MSKRTHPVKRIAGIVLAAGRSARMGRPKARLSIEGQPALVRLVRVLREAELDPVLVVGSEEVEDAIVVAGEPEGEMIDSLARGIAALPPEIEAAVVQPVDAPFTTKEAIALLSRDPTRARVLAFEGTPGHPVLVPRALFPAIIARPEGGLRSLLVHAELVPWDRSVLADLDTPADLEFWKVHE